jgi:cytoskeletal protein RodZ
VCGIVLSKFVPSQAETDTAAVEFAHFSHTDAEGGKRWLSVGLSLVVLALIGLSVVIWAMHRDKQKLQDVSTDTKPVLEQVGSPADTSKEGSSEDSPVEVNPDEESTAVEADEPAAESGGIQTPEATLEEPTEQVSDSPQPVEKPSSPPPDKGAYVTGELRRFTTRDFKKEVVEASRTYPVIFQFYSDT